MTARPSHETLIEDYVLDVIRRLPRKQRNDVGFELRALLTEGLRGRAADEGRLPDDAMALAIVNEFGRPDEVAARYHPPGESIIPPQHTRGFALATVIGVALQWGVSLPLSLSGELAPNVPEGGRFTAWWVTYGLGAFWWPGFMVSMMLIAAWVRQTWPAMASAWKPAAKTDPNHVNRPLYMLGLVLALCGIAIWVLVAWAVTTLDNPFTRALAFAPDFLATRAPVLLLFWAAGVALLVVLIVEGRWRNLTRRIDFGSKIAACLLMVWFIVGGRIFVSESADQTTKGALWLIVLLILCDFAVRAWRLRTRIHPPVAEHGGTQHS